jgi:hypothetical protein
LTHVVQSSPGPLLPGTKSPLASRRTLRPPLLLRLQPLEYRRFSGSRSDHRVLRRPALLRRPSSLARRGSPPLRHHRGRRHRRPPPRLASRPCGLVIRTNVKSVGPSSSLNCSWSRCRPTPPCCAGAHPLGRRRPRSCPLLRPSPRCLRTSRRRPRQRFSRPLRTCRHPSRIYAPGPSLCRHFGQRLRPPQSAPTSATPSGSTTTTTPFRLRTPPPQPSRMETRPRTWTSHLMRSSPHHASGRSLLLRRRVPQPGSRPARPEPLPGTGVMGPTLRAGPWPGSELPHVPGHRTGLRRQVNPL